MPQYQVVFDISRAGYRQWWFPAAGLVFVLIGIAWLRYRPDPGAAHGLRRRYGPYIFTGIATLWTLVAFGGTYYDYWRLRSSFESGHFTHVEGMVTHFKPVPVHVKGNECFEVAGHRYCYSDSLVVPGFNNMQSHGGPIRDGLLVRIADVNGEIARLEIAH